MYNIKILIFKESRFKTSFVRSCLNIFFKRILAIYEISKFEYSKQMSQVEIQSSFKPVFLNKNIDDKYIQIRSIM